MAVGDSALRIPDPGLVVLCGAAGCGKSSFAARHFRSQDVLSSDDFRALVSGDAADQGATADAFGLLTHALDKRMKRRRLTVVDATNVTRRERARLTGAARKHEVPAVAIAFDLPLDVCQERSRGRSDREVPDEIVERQHTALRRQLGTLDEESFASTVRFTSSTEIDAVVVERRTASPHPPRPRRSGRPPAVVVDLDGTLAPAAAREHGRSEPCREGPAPVAAMCRDAPLGALLDLLHWVTHHAEVVVLTGRPADEATAVRRWLADHAVAYDRLLMRAAGDRRADIVVKRELYRSWLRGDYDVRLVIDDRPRAVEMWRGEGRYVLTALDPRPHARRTPGTGGP